MAVYERRRIELFERLSASVGEEAATTLFDLLPPPSRDVATRDDVADLRRDMEARFDRVDARFEQIEERFDARFGQMNARLEQMENRLSAAFERRINDAITAQTRTIIFGLLGTLVVIGGYAASLARFAG